MWGKVGYGRAQRAGVEGLLPPLHLGSEASSERTVVPFRGTFDHTLDAKNRLTIPARYRAALSDGVVLAMPIDMRPCVGVWRPAEYESFSRRALDEISPLSPRRSELERFFYGNSQEADLDAAGRIMIPGFLGDHAQLKKEVVVVGVGDRMELWSREGWNEHQPTLLSGVEEITASVADA